MCFSTWLRGDRGGDRGDRTRTPVPALRADGPRRRQDMIRRGAERRALRRVLLTVDPRCSPPRARPPHRIRVPRRSPMPASSGPHERVTPHGTSTDVARRVTWRDLERLRSCPLPILVKGVLTAEDATLAVERGAEGIVVSNHGGRQLDGGAGLARCAAGGSRGGRGAVRWCCSTAASAGGRRRQGARARRGCRARGPRDARAPAVGRRRRRRACARATARGDSARPCAVRLQLRPPRSPRPRRSGGCGPGPTGVSARSRRRSSSDMMRHPRLP